MAERFASERMPDGVRASWVARRRGTDPVLEAVISSAGMIIADHPVDVTADPPVPPRSDDYLHYRPARMTASLLPLPARNSIFNRSPHLPTISKSLPNSGTHATK